MPRPKTYNEDKVLTAAMLCFWRKGYTATSIKDLEAATGLTPGSIYNSFDSKDGLFLQAMDHYIDKVVRARVRRFLQAKDPIAGIEEFFLDCFRSRAATAGLGCLLINTSTELGPHDEVVRKKVVFGMKIVDEALSSAIVRAQTLGRIAVDVDPKARGAHLGLLLNGMLVNAKVASNQNWLKVAMGSVKNLLH